MNPFRAIVEDAACATAAMEGAVAAGDLRSALKYGARLINMLMRAERLARAAFATSAQADALRRQIDEGRTRVAGLRTPLAVSAPRRGVASGRPALNNANARFESAMNQILSAFERAKRASNPVEFAEAARNGRAATGFVQGVIIQLQDIERAAMASPGLQRMPQFFAGTSTRDWC